MAEPQRQPQMPCAPETTTSGATSPYTSKLHIPVASSRPGQQPDFSRLHIPAAGATPRPAIDTPAAEMQPLAYGLIRVLDGDGQATGPWRPELSPEQLRAGLRHMMHVRAYDDRMFRMQRQGKLSFYMKCTGEEAIAVAQGMALEKGDMLFPTYRQQGLLFVRRRPVVDMMCHCISNSKDNLKGRQMPTFYSWKEGNYYSISGNLATQYSQAVGWAMASAYKGEDHIACSWVGDGSTAEADVYHALLFASTYRAPVILNVVNNQWAISVPRAIQCGAQTLAQKAFGAGIRGEQVDGNDAIAMHEVLNRALDRAREGKGPTLIEAMSYRLSDHTTADDATRYRDNDELKAAWEREPIKRLQTFLHTQGWWDEDQEKAWQEEVSQMIQQAVEGYLATPVQPVEAIFDHLYADMPQGLREQRDWAVVKAMQGGSHHES